MQNKNKKQKVAVEPKFGPMMDAENMRIYMTHMMRVLQIRKGLRHYVVIFCLNGVPRCLSGTSPDERLKCLTMACHSASWHAHASSKRILQTPSMAAASAVPQRPNRSDRAACVRKPLLNPRKPLLRRALLRRSFPIPLHAIIHIMLVPHLFRFLP